MAEAIGAVLAFAVGVGVSPVPIIAIIVVLFSERATVNGPVFLAGWLVGLAAVVTAIYLVADALDVGSDATAEDTVSWIRLVLGVVLLVGAWRTGRGRSTADEPAMPTWMSRVDRLSAPRATGLGVALAANPKNLMLAAGAGSSLSQVGASTVEVGAALTAFVLVGSTFVITAVVYDRLGGARARSTLDDARAWLLLHYSAVMAVLFVVFGAVLISQGLGGRG
jgi:threonine/homoserine/homoserine lactone efflux protein